MNNVSRRKQTFVALLTISLLVMLILLAVLLVKQRATVHEQSLYAGPAPEGAITRLGKGTIYEMVGSPNRRYLAVRSSIGVYLYRTDTLGGMWVAPCADLYRVEFSPNSRTLVGVTPSGLVEWDVRTGSVLHIYDRVWDSFPDDFLFRNDLYETDVFWQARHPDRIVIPTFSVAGPLEDDTFVHEWGISVVDVSTGDVLQTMSTHDGPIDNPTFSIDGNEIAEARRWTSTIWDLENGQESRTFGLPQHVTQGPQYSPDGSTIAVGTFTGLYVLDAQTGAVLQQLTSTDGVWSMAYNHNGTRLAAGTSDGVITVINLDTNEQINSWESGRQVDSLVWGRDSSTLITMGEDSTIVAWNIHSGKALRIYEGHLDLFGDVAWSPDSARLATASVIRMPGYGDDQGLLAIWDVEGNLLNRVEFPQAISSVAWSPDSTSLALWDSSGRVRLLDAETLSGLRSLRFDSRRVTDIAWSPDGSRLAFALGDREVWVYDVRDSEIVHAFTTMSEWRPSPEYEANPVISVDWSPDGSQLAAGMWDGPAYVWDAATGELLAQLEHYRTAYPDQNSVIDLNWSPGGRRVAGGFGHEPRMTLNEDGMGEPSPSDAVAIWDVGSGEKERALQTLMNFTLSLDWSPTDRLMAISLNSMDGGELLLWDTEDGSQVSADDLPSLDGHNRPVYSLAWSPDGTMLASVSEDGTVLIWQIVP